MSKLTVDPERRGEPGHRYMMPSIEVGHKTFGVKQNLGTEIANIEAVAKALARPADHVLKFIDLETPFAMKATSIRGEWSQEEAQACVDRYIVKFALCEKCRNPETDIAIINKCLTHTCRACGFTTTVKGDHKLVKHIVGKGGQGGDDVGGKFTVDKKVVRPFSDFDANLTSNMKKLKPIEKAHKCKVGVQRRRRSDEVVAVDFDVVGGDVAAARAALEAEFVAPFRKPGKATAAPEVEEPEQRSTARSSSPSPSPSLDEGTDDSELVDILRARMGAGADRLAIVEHFQAERGLKDPVIVRYLAEAAFTANVLAEVEAFAAVFARYCGPKAAQADKCQAAVVLSLEELIGERFPAELNTMLAVSKIFQAFYEHDVLSEELILKWAAKGVKGRRVDKAVSRAIRANCAPFVKWLQDSSDED